MSNINISTAEDPVEINLEGINQVNVNPKVGLDFTEALRSFLRQDPDVIMVGGNEARGLRVRPIEHVLAFHPRTLRGQVPPPTMLRWRQTDTTPETTSVSYVTLKRRLRHGGEPCTSLRSWPRRGVRSSRCGRTTRSATPPSSSPNADSVRWSCRPTGRLPAAQTAAGCVRAAGRVWRSRRPAGGVRRRRRDRSRRRCSCRRREPE